MAQTSFLLFMSVIVAMAVCMAWRVADDELAERLVSEGRNGEGNGWVGGGRRTG